MDRTPLLETLFKQQSHRHVSDAFSQSLDSLVRGEYFSLETLVDDCVWEESSDLTTIVKKNWRNLLALSLLNYFSENRNGGVRRLIRVFESKPWNQDSQFFRALVSFVYRLNEIKLTQPSIRLLDGGAALIELREYAPWLSIPYHPQHLELGIYLCGLAKIEPKLEWIESVRKLADWQLNALDGTGVPIASLFMRESDGHEGDLNLLYYLFYRGVSSLIPEDKYNLITQRLEEVVSNQIKTQRTPPDSLWVLLERFFKFEPIEYRAIDLPATIYDSSTALIGHRTLNQTIVCTAHGGHTGLGYVKFEDVEIINYGPQYFPLDDCRGFGIEGNQLSDHGLRKSFLETHRHGFSIKGCLRLVDQPSENPKVNHGLDRYRGIWMDAEQEYHSSKLTINTSFLGLEGWEGVGFSFFVKVNHCWLNHGLFMYPKRLDRYDGEIRSIQLRGEHGTIEIDPINKQGTMQVIPLSGEANFWGANFLITYVPTSEAKKNGWSIRLK